MIAFYVSRDTHTGNNSIIQQTMLGIISCLAASACSPSHEKRRRAADNKTHSRNMCLQESRCFFLGVQLATHTHRRRKADAIHSIQILSPFSACMDFFFCVNPLRSGVESALLLGMEGAEAAASSSPRRLENCICCFLRYHLSPP